MKIVLISGKSGSGKSSALHALEDCGFYCIDNLPLALTSTLIETLSQEKQYAKVAVSLDIRNFSGDEAKLKAFLEAIEQQNIEYQIVFLDSDEETLVKRYNASRRKHPLSSESRSLREAIALEKAWLAPILDVASLIMDTSTISVHELRATIRQRIANHEQGEVSLLFQSFGFKHGIPTDSDLMFDVRCLPNPYWEPTLRNFTGKDTPIKEFLEKHSMTHKMFEDIKGFVEYWLPQYKESGRAYLTVSIGCTGGCHRSVYLAERLSEHFSQKNNSVHLKHNEL